MMTNPLITQLNCETNESIDRPMTDAEFTDYQLVLNERLEELNKTKSNAEAKSALLKKLGITAEEAALLVT